MRIIIQRKCIMVGIIAILLIMSNAQASDWPIYKGNIFFTGNNDEITVKNNNLKWLYQADEIIYNPIISDGRIYFLDLKKNIYCLNELTGKLIWKQNLKVISARFYTRSRAFGKVKYPLVAGNSLILTDSYVIYSFDKRSGKILWARTGMRDEKELLDKKSRYNQTHYRWQPGSRKNWAPRKGYQARVDGIYSDPVIHDNVIYYGTKNVFIAREINQGHLLWNNKSIKSWSGFPSFYDRYLFTQSMDYMSKSYILYCIIARSGKVQWKKNVQKPLKIYSPVVYKEKVFLASGSLLYSIDLKDGHTIWEKDYSGIITSNPAFTERNILFTVDNRKIVIINPDTGVVVKTLDPGEKSRPFFVTIRDQIYVANTFKRRVGKHVHSYASLKAINFNNKKTLWRFNSPFPGGAYQPSASGGIMFVPAGNYLYAVGTDYYPRIIDGGSGDYRPSDGKKDNRKKRELSRDNKRKGEKSYNKAKMKFRDITLSVLDGEGNPLSGDIEIKKWLRGKLLYSKRIPIPGRGMTAKIPDMEGVEITASSADHVPKKVIISRKDRKKRISLEKIKMGKGIAVDNILFEINEAYLRKESLNILDRMIDALRRNPRLRLEVRGHTDTTGPRAHNMRLSRRRADAVKDYMIKNGISPRRLRSKGFGPDKPITSNSTKAGRKKNRRTEFFILNK